MTASPDRPSTARQFVVDTLSVNQLRTPPGKRGRVAEGPIHVWNLELARLTLWPHPCPPAARAVPLVTDLMRTLESRRWRFDIEHLPREIGDAFGQYPEAEGFQLFLWLNRAHVPEGYPLLKDGAVDVPGVPKVMLFDVTAPDRTPEPGHNGTETLSGVAEGFPDRPRGSLAVLDLSAPDVVAHQGIVSISHHQAPPAGLYATHAELDDVRASR